MTATATGRMALYLQDKHPIRDGMRYARYAEERGFEAVWQAESRLVREATVPMTAYAAVTSRIKVGSGVIPIWTRNVHCPAPDFPFSSRFDPASVSISSVRFWGRRSRRKAAAQRMPFPDISASLPSTLKKRTRASWLRT